MSDAREPITDRQCPRREWMSSGFSDEEERRGGHMKRPRHEKGVFRVLTDRTRYRHTAARRIVDYQMNRFVEFNLMLLF
ncbi:hypothetical protein NC653_037098 [Populus alba x Populus x berolinensis]|uniref:Uncharacterized protein n=1 Tax=Populus alba x Populus x berolinensis TaxID=444605 RepID=A0AAD6PVN2_9ROSI|nr:hypothetical protein NC653_037095 [Populus alba x Populus x berolinensis]KAJ6969329.1 hypothetical protein NC653_037098 [Populus alba x Populus x berolinensis]